MLVVLYFCLYLLLLDTNFVETMMQEKEDESSSRLLAGRVQESEEDLESLQSVSDARQHDSQRRGDWRRTAAVVVVFALSNLFSMHLGAHMRSTTADLDGACAAHTTQWSPVLEDVDVKYDWKHFNGSFLQEDIFRKEASPEVDAAWESMGVDCKEHPIMVSRLVANNMETALESSQLKMA